MTNQRSPGVLTVVATPIGNLDDLSPRARSCLASADIIAAEDTRVTRSLLKRLEIEPPKLISYHDHNEQSRVAKLIGELQAGRNIALVSDAGTPLVSDPGYRIVAAAAEAGLHVTVVPGPSATLAALAISGLPGDRFLFVGYCAKTTSARKATLRELQDLTATTIFFEGPHRLVALLADLLEVWGDRQAALVRNVTKSAEEVIRGTISEIHEKLAPETKLYGEFTLVVDRRHENIEPEFEAIDRTIDRLHSGGLPARETRDIICDLFEIKKKIAYERVLEKYGR